MYDIRKPVLLLTGAPGCGKTTLIKRIVARLSKPSGGFYTQEIRQGGKRLGFVLITLDGKSGILAHVNIKSSKRVGKYGVDLKLLERLAITSIYHTINTNGILIIDEIGPMEILSQEFRQAVLTALKSKSPILGSIVQRNTPFTDHIKTMAGVQILEVHPENRETLVDDILTRLEG